MTFKKLQVLLFMIIIPSFSYPENIKIANETAGPEVQEDASESIITETESKIQKYFKCCPLKYKIENGVNNSLSCKQAFAIADSSNSDILIINNYVDIQRSEIIAEYGFPNCSYKVLSNMDYRYFRFSGTTGNIEIALFCFGQQLWWQIDDFYCVDDLYGSVKEQSFKMESRSKLLVFCPLPPLRKFYLLKLILIISMAIAALFHLSTISIYFLVIIRRKKTNATTWIEFSIFLNELLECIGQINLCSYAYSDLMFDNYFAIPLVMYVAQTVHTLGLVQAFVRLLISLDVFLIVWKTFLSENRKRRNNFGTVICWVVPFIGYTVETLITYINRDTVHKYRDATDIFPYHTSDTFCYSFTSVISCVVATLAVSLFIVTTILLLRHSKNMKNSDELSHVEYKKMWNSYVICVKLFIITELPVVTLIASIAPATVATDPINMIWIMMFLCLVMAVYAFINFGCRKEHLDYLKQLFKRN